MPWERTCPVNERMQFIARLQQGDRMTDLCSEFGISRKTGHKLKKRFEAYGPGAFYDQARVPRRIPHRTSVAIRELVIAARKDHPTWGPKKLKVVLERDHAGVRLPAASTIGEILKAAGLVACRRRRPKRGAKPTDRRVSTKPNELWCADFKGEFRLGNGRYCYPLTISDAFSRYLIACVALDGTKGGPAQTVFEEVFEEYGLPEAILTDNGAPFASTGLAGLSMLSASWVRLGVAPERIEPGHPEQNGKHERMHRTLKAETTRPAGGNMLQQQERFDHFRHEYNEERPHEALEQQTPASAYEPSPRKLADAQGEPEYPLHDRVVTVNASGSISLPKGITGSRQAYVSGALIGQPVGLRELDDGRWQVNFLDLELGHVDPEVGFDPAPELA